MKRRYYDGWRVSEVRTFASGFRLLSLVALLAGAGCDSFLVDNYRYGSIAVSVTTPDGAGVPGVKLIVYNSSQDLAYGLTDPDGRYEFALVPFGDLGVMARTPEGFSSGEGLTWVYEDGIYMEQGVHEVVHLTIHRCEGRIGVRVIDDEGTPVEDVRVWVHSGPAIIAEMRTDPDGSIGFGDLPCGRLSVSLEAPTGYVLRPGRGGTYTDGLIFGTTEIEVVFTIDRVQE